jgi:hypothetical protein
MYYTIALLRYTRVGVRKVGRVRRSLACGARLSNTLRQFRNMFTTVYTAGTPDILGFSTKYDKILLSIQTIIA